MRHRVFFYYLAAATGIILKTIVNIETKQHIPSLLYAMRLAEYLHQPVTSLFCYQPGKGTK